MNTKTRRHPLLIFGVVIAVTATAAAFYTVKGSESEPLLTTVSVSRGDLVDSVQATGTLEAVTTVQVGTQVSGTIASLGMLEHLRRRKTQDFRCVLWYRPFLLLLDLRR